MPDAPIDTGDTALRTPRPPKRSRDEQEQPEDESPAKKKKLNPRDNPTKPGGKEPGTAQDAAKRARRAATAAGKQPAGAKIALPRNHLVFC